MRDTDRPQTLAMLEDTARKVFAGPYGDFAAAWHAAEAAGLTSATAGEEMDGIGAGFAEAQAILYAAGREAATLPVAESLLALKLLAGSGWRPAGPVTLAQRCEGAAKEGRFTGTASAAAFGADCRYVAMQAGREIICLTVADAVTQRGWCDGADLPYVELTFSGAPVLARHVAFGGPDDLRLQLAFLRACMMGGAIDAALALSIAHVTQREQFGRKLSQFQAIQQQLAVLAEEAAATNAAAMAAAEAADLGNWRFPFQAATMRAMRAAGEAASIAHQAHGAIGFTREYALQRYTRRLWCWRSELSNERTLAVALGGMAAKAGTEGFWPALVNGFNADP